MSALFPVGYGALQLAFTNPATFAELITALVVEAKLANKKILIDTARVYGDCEKLLGAVLQDNPKFRQWLFIIVKIGIEFNEVAPYHLTRDELISHVSDSLHNLGLASVDCIMLHRLPRKHKNFDEAVATLKLFQKEGKCQYVGLSEVSAETLLISNVDFVEIAYSPFSRTAEFNGVLEAARQTYCKVIIYTSVARGLMTDKIKLFVSNGVLKKEFQDMTNVKFQETVFELLQIIPFEHSVGYYEQNVLKKNIEVVANFVTFCEHKHYDPFQVCLAYSIAKGCIPIPGTTKIANMKKNMLAIDIKLTNDNLSAIDAITSQFKGDPNPKILAYLSEV